MPQYLRTVVVLGAVFAAVACGEESAEDAAASSAADYLQAFANRDGASACDQVTVEGKSFLAEFAATQLPELGTIDCSEVLRQLAAFVTDAQLDGLASVAKKIDGGDVQIRNAEATINIPGATVPMTLVRQDDRWKISAETLKASFRRNYLP